MSEVTALEKGRYFQYHHINEVEKICFLRYKSLLHGPPMMADKTNFGLVLYNHANFYRFEETSIVIGKLNEYQFFSAFH